MFSGLVDFQSERVLGRVLGRIEEISALGFAEESQIPFTFGIIRNHYVGRTIIEPEQSIRHFGVKIKLNAVRDALHGRRVILVDDSIVRGTTSRKIVKMVRDAGAKEVHMRISAPPTTHSCFYGIDTPTRKELIASNHSIDEINRYLTSDSLGYLSLQGLYQCAKLLKNSFCDACFSGEYPVKISETLNRTDDPYESVWKIGSPDGSRFPELSWELQ